MISHKTVFVLGAGASQPYLGVEGSTLPASIRHFVFDNNDFQRELAKHFGSGAVEQAQEMVEKQRGSRISIDHWLGLDDNKAYRDIGRFCIAWVILRSEGEWPLSEVKPEEREKFEWDVDLWSRLFVPQGDIASIKRNNSVSFVTFNYDRSLEHLLMCRAKDTFSSTRPEDCAKVLAEIPILHVHGQLGRLPWQVLGKVGELPEQPYGGGRRLDSDSVLACSKYVRIPSETNRETSEYKDARDLLVEARFVYFLGFGYHEGNLKKLSIEGGGWTQDRMGKVKGTGKGVSLFRRLQLASEKSDFGCSIEIKYDDIREFFGAEVEGL